MIEELSRREAATLHLGEAPTTAFDVYVGGEEGLDGLLRVVAALPRLHPFPIPYPSARSR
eukprot:5253879-Pyramimonas_sp.AAC.1